VANVEKLLPQSLEAELGVIGSCMIDLDVIPSVLAIVKPEDFYREKHRHAVEVIRDLFERGIAPDLITICDEMERRGWLEDAGGYAGVSELANQVPTSANAEYYAGIVARKAWQRRFIGSMGQGAALAYAEAEPEAIMTAHLGQLAKLGNGGTDGVRDFADVMDEAWGEVQETATAETPPGVYTGLAAMDEHTMGFRPKEMIIIAGRPGTFKSTVGGNWAVAEALRQAGLRAAGKPWGTVLWVSLEMSRTAQAKRVISALSGIDTRRIRAGFRLPDGTIHRRDMARFEETYREYRERLRGVLRIVDAPSTLSQLRTIAMREVAERNLQAIFLDQFDLLEPEEWSMERRQAEHERLNAAARGLKLLAMGLNITVFVLVQLNRDSVKEARPGLHNLAGTDGLGRHADGVIMTHYPAQHEAPPAAGASAFELEAYERKRRFLELLVVKMRDGEGGVTIAAEIEPRFARVGAWSLGGPETWPEDPTRRMGAPRPRDVVDADPPEARDFEPGEPAGGYSQSGF
jgi:replicative DNA helicase